MKLLVVTQYFSPENFRINDLVAGLVARGHEVTVLTGQPNYPGGRFFTGYGWFGRRRERLLGAEVVRVPLVARGNGRAPRLMLNYLSFVWFASVAVIFRLRGAFDAIFVFEPSPVTVAIPAIIARRRFGAPILFWVLDLWPESLSAAGPLRSPRVLRWVGRGVRWLYARCERILVQSRGFVPNLKALGVSESKIRYFPNWIEAEYEPSIVLPHLGGPERRIGEFRIVFAGNIGVAQDFPAILDAATRVAEQVPNVRWVIAGEGRMADWVHSEVERRGLGAVFEFLGQLPAAVMPSVFAEADALLVTLRPDPVFSLTIPGKVQSYLSAGKPVLAMLDGEGARIVTQSGGGFACAAGDSGALAELVARLARLPEAEKAAIGHSGRDYALGEFGRAMLFDRLESWIRELLVERDRKGQT